MDRNTNLILFAMLRSALDGNPLSEEERTIFSKDMLSELYLVSVMHDVAHLIGAALWKNALADDSKYSGAFRKKMLQAAYRYEKTNYDSLQINSIFEENKIQHMFLKGAVIKNYYPEPWMRTSCDIDVLVKDEDIERAVEALSLNGWTVKGEKKFHDISLYSESGTHLELHFSIKEAIDGIDSVLEKVWEYSYPAAGKMYEYCQENEYIIFHALAHMTYHFVAGGCGIRPFADINILKKSLDYSEDKLLKLCDEGGIRLFYENVSKLTEIWFDGEKYTPLTAQMAAFVIKGGAYGTSYNRIIVSQAKVGGKAKNLFLRIFMPYSLLKTKYPILEKHKILTPAFQVVRWFELFDKSNRKRAVKELKISGKRSSKSLKATEKFLQDVGILEKPKNK